MKTRTILLISAVVGLLFAGGHLRAEVDAACCRCSSFYKLSDEGFGFMRHHVGFCPKCTAEMGGDPEQYLARLHGRHRGLSDAATLTGRKLMEAIQARDQARDSIYGREGSATGFFTALIGLAAEGAGGAIKKVGMGVKKGLGYYNKAADTLEGDLGWVLDEGKDWVEDKTVGEAKKTVMRKAAAGMAQTYQAGNPRATTGQFLRAHGDIKKGVSILESAIKFYEKTDKLANGIQDYLEHRADAERLDKEKNDLDDQAQAVQDEMDKLKHCLEMQKEQAAKKQSLYRPPAAPGRRPAGPEGWTVRFASATATPAEERARIHALVYPPGEPDAATMKSALTALQRLRTELADFIRQLEEEMVPPLLPFWYDMQSELGRDLAKALLEWADPATEKAARQYDRIMRYGQGIEEDVKRAAPRTEKI